MAQNFVEIFWYKDIMKCFGFHSPMDKALVGLFFAASLGG